MPQDESKKIAVKSQITGVLVNSGMNAMQVIKVLDEVKATYLERSWHISSSKKAD